MTRKIHQLVHTLSYGDAISGEVLALQRAFRAQNAESEIYAINIHPKYCGLAHDYREFVSSNGADYNGEVILHYSLGSPLNELYRTLAKAYRVIIHHNLTPAHWFSSINPRIVKDIEQGVRELPQLCAVSSKIVSDSEFNASEIRDLGFQSDVLELPIDPQRWQMPANSGIASLLSGDPGIHILHVGRLAPNKCIEDLIRIFYFVHHHCNRKSTLWLPGIDIDTELYSFGLKRLIYELNLGDAVRMIGCVDDSELKALYQNSSVYLCMSEHEGFCLPIVEAMYFNLPVIAYSSSAIPQTVKHGGVLVNEKRPAEIAELIVEICQNMDLRNKLIQAGNSRVEELSYEKFEENVMRVFAPRKTSVDRVIGA